MYATLSSLARGLEFHSSKVILAYAGQDDKCYMLFQFFNQIRRLDESDCTRRILLAKGEGPGEPRGPVTPGPPAPARNAPKEPRRPVALLDALGVLGAYPKG